MLPVLLITEAFRVMSVLVVESVPVSPLESRILPTALIPVAAVAVPPLTAMKPLTVTSTRSALLERSSCASGDRVIAVPVFIPEMPGSNGSGTPKTRLTVKVRAVTVTLSLSVIKVPPVVDFALRLAIAVSRWFALAPMAIFAVRIRPLAVISTVDVSVPISRMLPLVAIMPM